MYQSVFTARLGMNKSTEAHYRDIVAADLSAIDESLSLVGVEHSIRLPDGRLSKIDILAKDKFGCFTVIEIKKSNQTARSAVQQLYKYAHFLKRKNRLRVDQIRCVAISTHWDELRAPFSEFSHFSPYESIALGLIINKDDSFSVSKIECEYEVGGGEAVHNYIYFEFKSEDARNSAYENFSRRLHELVPNLSSVIMKFNAKEKNIINPYGFSWSIFRTGMLESSDEFHTLEDMPDLSSNFFSASFFLPSWRDGSIETELRELILRKVPIVKISDGEYGCYAIHSLNNDLHRSEMIELLKLGPMFEDGLYSEEETRALACGFLGKHPYNFVAEITPRRVSHLNFVREQAQNFLKSNPSWRQGVSQIFDELSSNAEVRITIYNPLNFCAWLLDLYQYGTSNRIPSFTIIGADENTPISYFGTLIWNGSISNLKLKNALKSVYPSMDFALLRHVNQWKNDYDDKLFKKFGIKHEVFKQTAEGVFWLNTYEDPARWEKSTKNLESLNFFLKNHDHLVEAVGKCLGSYIHGI